MEPSQPQHSAPKKSHTGLIIGCAAAGGVLLLVLRIMLWTAVLAKSFDSLPWEGNSAVSPSVETTPPSSQAEESTDLEALDPGSTMGNGIYTLNCREYIDRFEILLTQLENREITVEQSTGRNYKLLAEGQETKIQLRFYQNHSQVDGIEDFQIVEIYSGENTTMSPLASHACAVGLYLTDSTMTNLPTATAYIQSWDKGFQESSHSTIRHSGMCLSPGNVCMEFMYLPGGRFQSMMIEDRTASGY